MNQSTYVLKHVSLIKFIGGPHQGARVAAKAHPLSPYGKFPTLTNPKLFQASWKLIQLQKGEVLLRNRLSRRFRYIAPSVNEAEHIESGGAEILY